MNTPAVPRARLYIYAAALVVAGLAWAIQGYGERSRDPAVSHPEWLWIGLACAALGAMIVVGVNRVGGAARAHAKKER